MFEDMIEWPNY